MKEVNYLIIGGGIAGTTAAETIRAKDSSSSVTILTEESERVYSRVLLPHYLRNETAKEGLFIRKLENYTQNNIDLLTNTKVTKVDNFAKEVSTSDGQVFHYNKLLIASGGKVNKLEIPGANLPQVAYLRTYENALRVKELMSESKKAVIVGSGFIGAEFAQSFVKNGIDTTAIIREKNFWDSVVGDNFGKLLSQILTENGVKIISETEVVEFLGKDKLEGVKTNKGNHFEADTIGIGIGIHLETEYLKYADLVIKQGVVTNEFLETSAIDVWAAGDIAEFYDPILKKYHLLGNWANASAQGRTVGLNMVGKKVSFETNSMYSINLFNINFSSLGDPTVDEQTEVIERGNVAEKKLARLLIKEDVVIGASLINLPLERNIVGKLISNQTKITASKSRLIDPNFNLSTLI